MKSRVTLLVGHFGSGKTEIALNVAIEAASSSPVTLVDLDIVKPYFRSRAARSFLSERGIELVAPGGEHAHADLPIIVPRVRGLFRRPEGRVIVDVGGDDTGARVLGSLAELLPEGESECLLVLNFCRPFTRDPAEAVTMARQIEKVSRVPIAGLISNTHLMDETTPELVMGGFQMALETARQLGVPLKAVSVLEDDLDGLSSESFPCPVVHLQKILVTPVERNLKPPAAGPLFVLS